MWRGGHTDIEKLIVAFRNFAKAPIKATYDMCRCIALLFAGNLIVDKATKFRIL